MLLEWWKSTNTIFLEMKCSLFIYALIYFHWNEMFPLYLCSNLFSIFNFNYLLFINTVYLYSKKCKSTGCPKKHHSLFLVLVKSKRWGQFWNLLDFGMHPKLPISSMKITATENVRANCDYCFHCSTETTFGSIIATYFYKSESITGLYKDQICLRNLCWHSGLEIWLENWKWPLLSLTSNISAYTWQKIKSKDTFE